MSEFEMSLNGVAETSQAETVNLSDFAAEPGGAWKPGWYKAEIIEGYATRKGTQFLTEDSVSQKGDSRNLRICFKVSDGHTERTMQESFNYRSSDFTPERLNFIKEARVEFKDVRGRWSDSDAQRSSLAIAKIGQFQKALASPSLQLSPNGGIVAAPFLHQSLDVRLGIDENGYNVITAYSPSGSKTR